MLITGAYSVPTAGTYSGARGGASVFFGLAGLASPLAMLAAGVQAGAEGQDWKDEKALVHSATALKDAGPHSGAPTKQTVE